MSDKLSMDDVQRILTLLDASNFDELKIETGDFKLSLRRSGSAEPEPAATAFVKPAPVAVAASAPPAAPVSASGLPEIKSPMLGVFYRSPKPGAPPFVEIGTNVGPDTVIGIIEVMKLMNPVSAGTSGTIAEILITDGTMVEYEQPLMRVRP